MAYPANDLQVKINLLSLLGSFWSTTYGGRDLVGDYALGRGLLEQQTLMNVNELADSTSREDIPTFHKKYWYPVVIKQSELLPSPPEVFGGSLLYGPQADNYVYQFGVGRFPSSGVTQPSTLNSVNVINNKITNATVTLIRNIDFIIDAQAQALYFRENPFDNEEFPVTLIFDGTGVVVDRELTIWLFMADFDTNNLYTQFGYIIGLNLSSSDSYKQLIKATFSAVCNGNNDLAFRQALAAMTNVPTVIEPVETVETIFSDTKLKIVTDKNVYAHALGATAAVSVGDIVRQGDFLVNSVRIHNFKDGTVPSYASSIVVPMSLLVGTFSGDLTFSNSSQNTTVILTDPLHTEIRFPITGASGDISLFWETIQSNGIAAGETLANLLDLRDNPTTEPLATNLPSTINPAEFIAQNVLRNCILVTVKADEIDESTLDLAWPMVIKTLVAPQYHALLVKE